MLRSPVSRQLALLAAVMAGLAASDAEAAKGKISVLNCADKVKLCVFDKSDGALLVEASSATMEPGDYSTHVKCSTNGGCKVKVVKSGAACTSTNHETVIMDAKTLDEVAYRLTKDKSGGYSFDKVSDDRAYFDKEENRQCSNESQMQVSLLNCLGRDTQICVYSGSKLRFQVLSHAQHEATLNCHNAQSCTIITGVPCQDDQPRNTSHTLNVKGAYWLQKGGGFTPVRFNKASDDLKYFFTARNAVCPQ